MAKGKQVDSKSAEKLTRNEEKLIKIKESTSKFTSDLCLLIEEVTERSWRDLHPLLVKIAQFDVTLSKDEAAAIASLNTVVSELKRVAVTHGIKPQARLKDLENLDPGHLSTRKSDRKSPLALENGFAGTALGGSASSTFSGNSYDDMHFPPGSTAPQGLGGFPVQIKSSNLSDVGRASSFDGSTSGHSSAATGGAFSTMDMMAINASAAPAPTVDALAQAFGPSASISGPSSGGVPSVSRNRNHSLDSLDSFVSGHSTSSAPPPAAPPPPPPPAGGSGYHPFGSSHAPPPVAHPNVLGSAPNSFGAPLTYGSGIPQPPAPSMYGNHPPSAPSSYGRPLDPYASGGNFGQQQPYMQPPPPAGPSSYGLPPPSPYGQPQQPTYGQPQQPSYGKPYNPTNPF
jgi:hypothetical protein